MEIISITRDTKGVDIPETFCVGVQPVTKFQQKEEIQAANEGLEYHILGPVVKTINFYETGCFQGKAYRGKCYVVTFVDSTVKRMIQADKVVDIAIETLKEEKQELPKLPE